MVQFALMSDKTKKREVVRVSPEERAKQVREVLDLMEQGTSENRACAEVGINRLTFRHAALKAEAVSEYARSSVALAEDQLAKVEQTIQDMRAGIVDANMARVEIDTRKWFASKFLPKKYGDKLDLTSDGKALPTPISAVQINLADATHDVKTLNLPNEVSENAG